MSIIKSRIVELRNFEITKENLTIYSVLIAILFHVSGAIGMHTNSREWFITMTPFTLIFMGLLLIATDLSEPSKLLKTFITAYIIGYLAEFIGVNTGLLFGEYIYGIALGIKVAEVPLMIGFLWFMSIFGIGNLVNLSLKKLKILQATDWKNRFLTINIAAVLTMIFDIILEPAAISLGYWNWENGNIPIFNYISWYMVSAIIYLYYFHWHGDTPVNKFSIGLIMIQTVFFMVLS